MQQPLSLFLASRNIKSKRDNRFISFIVFISTLGLVLGVAALITILSVMNGFKAEMQSKLLGVIPHIQAYAPTLTTDWQSTIKQLKDSDPNIKQISPTLNAQAMLALPADAQSITGSSHILLLNGVIPEYEKQLSFLGQAPQHGQGMIQGSLDTLNDTSKNNIILGEALANEFGLKVGDTVHIILPKPTHGSDMISPASQNFTISGIFKVSKASEQRLAFTHLSSVANTLKVDVGAQGFHLQLHDVFVAKQTANTLTQLHPEFTVQPWTQTHGSVYRVLQLNRNMSGLLLSLVIVVAGFNLISSLVMVVTEKKAEIAILKTMGATPKLIKAVFFWQGLIITAIGTAIGTVLGLGLAYYIGPLSKWFNSAFALGLFDNYFVTQLPSVIDPRQVLFIIALSVMIGIIATIYPAMRAAKIAPAQALRHE
ncbi:MAG: ABC transporter permease [Moraxella sp.]|nr:ABC transporter permease [Moraxella sp.]